MPPKATKRRVAYGEQLCPHCKKVFNVKGFGMHKKSCCPHQEQEEPAPAVNIGGDANLGPGENGTLCTLIKAVSGLIQFPCR